jgi:hypothetical protein
MPWRNAATGSVRAAEERLLRKPTRPRTAHGEPRGVKREAEEDCELTPPNGWRGGLVCRVLSAESVLGLAIYEALFKGGVGAT